MPPMPPEFYVPAMGFMVSWLGILGGVCKVLWSQHVADGKLLHEYESETATAAARALALSSEALRGNTEILTRMASENASRSPRARS